MSVAIFGGTFDPVHSAHVAMAVSAIKEFSLFRLVVVPNGNPPHKTDSDITDFTHRYNMACLAFSDISEVEVSDYELSEERLRYSLHTMRYFRSVYGEDTSFIIGADSLLTLHKWYEYETFIKENSFIVFHRKGDDSFWDIVNKYKKDYGADIKVSSMDYVNISSTYIRRMIKEDSLAPDILPKNVLDYIKKEGLYTK